MNHVFNEHLRKFILVFFDDILIFSKSVKEYGEHLRMTFSLLIQHQLYARKSKCQFVVASIEYLGHFISTNGVSTNPKKIQAIQHWPIPVTIKQLRGFLGLAGYYRRFIRGYGQISKPLTNLLKKFDFEIQYKKGQENKAADALFRITTIKIPALTLSVMRTNLLQAISDSWNVDPTVKEVI
uniref:Uncharacterized mitochondrial protein AtMg00860-like n=1 Tax=Nicotiana tabacum TaxID=4097 RepID=A0A1S3ZTJ8_TOBAC|nr:PREDICTED: uncharacterized mitochondrial protein AtMg00860-like [Nicotiana tabacum]